MTAAERDPKHHVLKCAPPYFQELWAGAKVFEVRRDDRDFQPGDTIMLREFDCGDYSGRACVFRIGYVLRDFIGLRKGYCAFSLLGAE